MNEYLRESDLGKLVMLSPEEDAERIYAERVADRGGESPRLLQEEIRRAPNQAARDALMAELENRGGSYEQASYPEPAQKSAGRGGPSIWDLPDVAVERETPTAPKDNSTWGNVKRGFSVATQQMPQLAYGLAAFGASGLETMLGEGGMSSAAKNWAVGKYNDWGSKIQANSSENDEFTTAYDKAKAGDFGAMVDWFSYGVGYTLSQGAQMLATGGVGSLLGKATVKGAAEKYLGGMVAKEAATLAAGKEVTEEITKMAVSNVASNLGQMGAIGAAAYGMEGGEIGGDLAAKSVKEGRALSGDELARGLGATLLAGSLEFVGDKLGYDTILGKNKFGLGDVAGIKGKAARGAVGVVTNAPAEFGTEYFQTGAENWGKGEEENILPFNQSEKAQRDALNSGALGAVGGAVHGVIGGAISRARTVDEAIDAANESISNPIQIDKLDRSIDKLDASVDAEVADRFSAPQLQSPTADIYNPAGQTLVATADGQVATAEQLQNVAQQNEQSRLAAMTQDAPLPGMMDRAVEQADALQKSKNLADEIEKIKAQREAHIAAQQALNTEEGTLTQPEPVVQPAPMPKAPKGAKAVSAQAIQSERTQDELLPTTAQDAKSMPGVMRQEANAENATRLQQVQDQEAMLSRPRTHAEAITAVAPHITDAKVMLPEQLRDARQKDGTKATKQEGKLIKTIGKLFGKNVVFYISSNAQAADGLVRGGDNKTIYLNANAGVSPLAVFGHEMSHQIRKETPHLWAPMANVIARHLGVDGLEKSWRDYYRGDEAQIKALDDAIGETQGAEREAAIQKFLSENAEDGKRSRADYILEEAAADMTGNRFREADFWRDVFQEVAKEQGKSAVEKLAMKIMAAVKRLVDAIAGRGFDADSFVDPKHLDEIRAAIKTAVKDYHTYQRDTKGYGYDETGYRPGGVKSNTEATGDGATLSTGREHTDEDFKDVRSLWLAMAEHENLFQFQRSEAKDLKGVMADMDGGLKVSERFIVERFYEAQGVDKWWVITMPDGKTAKVYQRGDEIWVNASDLKSGGSKGTALYAGLLNFAYNNDKVLIGDPLGVSALAVFRRTENMLASALKFGTTRHMSPAGEQKNPLLYQGQPSFKPGVSDKFSPMAAWEKGDDAKNLVVLLQTSYNNIKAFVPEAANVVYNFDSKRFEWAGSDRLVTKAEWEVLSQRLRDGLSGIASSSERASAKELASKSGEDSRSATLQRFVFSNTVLREESGEVRGSLLAKVRGQLQSEGLTTGADWVSYSKARPQETENKEGVIIGARPGEFDWTFAKGGTPAPIQHPTQMGPRVEKLGPKVEKILKSKPVGKLIEDLFGVTGLKVYPTLGQYKGKPEPSFALYGDGLTFEAADGISRLLGWAFAQESTIVTQPVYAGDEDTWPAFYVSNGKKLSKKEIDAVRAEAQKLGMDYSTSIDGTAFKFFFDGDDLDAYQGKVHEIAAAAKLKHVDRVGTRSTFNEAKDYLGSADEGAGRQAWYSEGGTGSSSLFGRAVDNLLIPYAKAVGSEGYRFSPDLFADRFGLTSEQREYIRAALRPASGKKLSTASIVSGEETLEVTKNDLRAKKQGPRSNNTDIMWALQNRAAENGLIEPGDYSDDAGRAIAQAIADEVTHHISRPEGKSAIGWYDAALKRAKDKYDAVFPELKTDPDKEMLFDAILGITSQGNDVHSNSVFAGRIYFLVTREGRSLTQAVEDLYGTFGGETRAIENNLLKLEQLIDRNGYDRMRDLMNKKMTVGEWNAVLRRDESLWYEGKPLKVEGAARQTVNGWMVFGPKIGSFINNLHGDYSTLTADLWFSRTWNRILGFSFLHTPLQEAPKYQAFKEALLAEHTKTDALRANGKAWQHGKDISYSDAELDALVADPDAMLALATELEEKYRKGFDFDGEKKSGYSVKSDLRRAAKNWIEHRNDSVAAPRNDNERAFQQDVVEDAQRMIRRKTGENLTIADIQAALWYHEKELFAMFGAGDVKAAPADYADAAQNFMDRYNDGDLFYVEKPKPRYIRGGKGDYLAGAQLSRSRQTDTPEFRRWSNGNNGQFDGSNPDIRRSPQRWYYSNLAKQVESAPEKVFGPAKQVKAWLQSNAGKLGIKADEIQWTGINDWLDLQQRVTKADVLAYLGANGVQVQEVVKGAPTEEFIAANRAYRRSIKDDAPESVQDELKAKADALRYGQEKYAKYVLPGGENYRELLLTLPKRDEDGVAFANDMEKKYGTKMWLKHLDAKEKARYEKLINPSDFRSNHWDEPNILAHIRFNDRTDADGNRVLFIEELQSDWGQKGKKEGFANKRLASKPSSYQDIVVGDRIAGWGQVQSIRQNNGALEFDVGGLWIDESRFGIDQVESRDSSMHGDAVNQRGAPSAPFVTDTKSWVALAVKRMIAHAAQNGYDKVAFVTGEQSADRYDLSKQIKTLYVTRSTPTGDFEISAVGNGGHQVISGKRAKDIGEVEGIIGKDMAKKVEDMQPGDFERKFSGLDLKVGGEGMKTFYDTIVPQVVNDVLKKVGGRKVESIRFNDFESKNGASDDKLLSDLGVEVSGTRPDGQPGFTITPEMREKVAGGQALFSPRRVAVDGIHDAFWTKIKNGESLTEKEFFDAIATGRRGTSRLGKIQRDGLRSDGPVGFDAVARWEAPIAGIAGGYYTFAKQGQLKGKPFLTYSVVPVRFAKGIDLNNAKEVQDRAINQIRMRWLEDDKYRVDVSGVWPDSYAFNELKNSGNLEERENGLFAPKLKNRNAETRMMMQEAVRRLAMLHGGIPDVYEQGRQSGARVGTEEVRNFSPEVIETNFSKARIIGDSGRQYTNAQKQMFKGVGREVNDLTVGEKLKELRKDLGKKLAQGIVDQFAPIRDITEKGYMLARLSKGATGAFEAFMHHGKLSLNGGAYDADTSGGVMEKVFYPLGKETTDFLYWIAGNRAERLAREGKENLFTPQDILAAKSLSSGTTDFDYTLRNGQVTRDRTKIYADALQNFNEFSKNVMDMAEQSGLIDADSRHLWEHDFYVPFYRVMEDDVIGGANIGKGLIRQTAFKKLKGGTESLNDLLSNTLMNWAHLVDASAKNRAAKETLEAAERLGAARQAVPGEKKTVWYMDAGQKQEFKVDDPYLLTAINGLTYAGLRGPMMDVLSKTKHWLTMGVTASPFFKIRNLIRDSVQAIATSDLGYNPIKNVVEGAKLTNRQRQEYVSALAGGGLIRFGTMLEGNEAARARQLIKIGASDEHILDSEGKIQRFYDKHLEPLVTAYNELGNRGEEINRMSLYDQLIKQGKSHAEASLLARDLMDFSMQGSWETIRFLTQVVPFMNARLQGLYKLGRAAKEDPAKMVVVLGGVTLASLALLAMYGDDDDWKKREDWDRDNYWWLKIGGTAFRIPKPFEIGAIATLAERSAEFMFDNEMTGERFRKVTSKVVLDQLSMNPVPQLIKPIIDLYANKDSFSGRPIETMGMEKLDPSYRFRQNTSMVARGISSAGNALTGENFLSPVQVDHLVRGYFSWLGSFVVGGADMAVRSVNDQPTRPALDYWKTATGGMVSDLDSASSRYVSQMYDQAKELEQAYGTYRNLVKEGKLEDAAEYREDNKEKLEKYRSVENVKRAEAKLNERIRMIERSNMGADEKRDLINAIRKQQNQIAKQLTPAA